MKQILIAMVIVFLVVGGCVSETSDTGCPTAIIKVYDSEGNIIE